MEIVTIPVVLVDEFYFYMHHPIKAWLFEKIIFELVYLFHIVLKSLVFLYPRIYQKDFYSVYMTHQL